MALAETGQVKKAAATIGASRLGVYKLRERDKNFAAAWDEAKRVAAIALEDEAHRRAMGWHDPRLDKDGNVLTDLATGEGLYHPIAKYSDTLLIFLMKGLMPETYGERQQLQHSGGVTLNVVTGVPPAVQDAEYVEVTPNEDFGDLC